MNDEIKYCPETPNDEDCKGCADWDEGICRKISWNRR